MGLNKAMASQLAYQSKPRNGNPLNCESMRRFLAGCAFTNLQNVVVLEPIRDRIDHALWRI